MAGGDRVAVMLPNCPQTAADFVAIEASINKVFGSETLDFVAAAQTFTRDVKKPSCCAA